jgi:hypothetical protein
MHQTLRRADLPYRNPKGTKTKPNLLEKHQKKAFTHSNH